MRTFDNIISSYFFYMWNSWSKEECEATFGAMSGHMWNKWCEATAPTVYGAAERFYKELSDDNRRLLADRACLLYDGRGKAEPIDESQIYVCDECGSTEIQTQVWVDANTNDYASDIDGGRDNNWCEECEDNIYFCTLAEFKERMQTWWNQCDFKTMGRITHLQQAEFSPADGCQAFVDACNKWWDALDYEAKRALWKQENQ